MKKYIQIFTVLLVLITIASCNFQKNADPLKDSIERNQERPKIVNPSLDLNLPKNDFDPYFTESSEIIATHGPTNITRNIIQDRNGYFWFASWEGIIGYAPQASEENEKSASAEQAKFTNFTNKEGLRRHRAFSLLEDRNGNIWFGTIGAGVYRYDGKTFTNFTTEDGLVNDDVGCIYEDKEGNIWFGTRVGVSCYTPSTKPSGQVSFRNFTTEDGLTNNDVNSIIEDKNGRFWFGTRGEACFYDPKLAKSGGNPFTNFKNHEGKSFTNVRCVIEDKKGNIWLGGNDGLWCYDPTSGMANKNSKSSGQTGFTNFTTNFVGYIFEDKKGDIWVNMSDEDNDYQMTMHRYDGNSLPYGEAKVDKIIRADGQIFGIMEDENRNIWFGTERGICRYNPSSDTRYSLLSSEARKAGEETFTYFK